MSKAKVAYQIAVDGTGGIQRRSRPKHWQEGDIYCSPDAAPYRCFKTYAEAREYARRTTGEALKIAQQNHEAAQALSEQEPEP